MNRFPTIGSPVHYVETGVGTGQFGEKCRAAYIIEIPVPAGNPAMLGLAVINPDGTMTKIMAENDDTGGQGKWHWPEQVGPWSWDVLQQSGLAAYVA